MQRRGTQLSASCLCPNRPEHVAAMAFARPFPWLESHGLPGPTAVVSSVHVVWSDGVIEVGRTDNEADIRGKKAQIGPAGERAARLDQDMP
jgi:hypothetical protein